MSEPVAREAKLQQLVREARAAQLDPDAVDYQRLERRLMDEVRRAPPAPARASHPSRRSTWAALALAAGATLWLVRAQAPVDAPSARDSAPAADPLVQDGESLAIGARVIADERAVSVTHAGRATWKLAPSSSALLTAKGTRITVELERGSVLSEVVPSSEPETFVVEAAGARVAVHGTVFRVSLEADRLEVQVRAGVVAVGPRGAAPAYLLEAPTNAVFSTDGLSGTINRRPANALPSRPSAPPKGRARAAASTSAAASTPPKVARLELPHEPSINDIEAGIAQSFDVTSDCFRRHTPSPDGVEVTVRTALSLRIMPDGSATHAEFQPPLSPDAEACARAALAHVVFVPSEQGAKVTRLLELKR